jgi:hypothetical protein
MSADQSAGSGPAPSTGAVAGQGGGATAVDTAPVEPAVAQAAAVEPSAVEAVAVVATGAEPAGASAAVAVAEAAPDRAPAGTGRSGTGGAGPSTTGTVGTSRLGAGRAEPADDIDLTLDGAPGARTATVARAGAPYAAPMSAPWRRTEKVETSIDAGGNGAAPSAAGPLSEPAAPPAPDRPKPSATPAPDRPKPSAPDRPKPSATPAPDRPKPSAPDRPKPSAPDRPKPSGTPAKPDGGGGAAGRRRRAGAHRPGPASFFRESATDDPSPNNGQLIGICAGATVLGLAGLLVAVRGLFGIVGGYAPTWYQPALIIVGMVGILLTVVAFMAIHRQKLPWIMLALSMISLAVNVVLTIVAV